MERLHKRFIILGDHHENVNRKIIYCENCLNCGKNSQVNFWTITKKNGIIWNGDNVTNVTERRNGRHAIGKWISNPDFKSFSAFMR